MTLYVFNPEHDICLANGDAHFVPPPMALRFAARSCGVMRWLSSEPDKALCTTADGVGALMAQHPGIDIIVPWGWDATLVATLLKQGVPEALLPSEEQLRQWRRLQHRTTALSVFPTEAVAAASVEEVLSYLSLHHNIILKAPWSGSGQGIRPVRGQLTQHDRGWIANICRRQACVIAEPRYEVVQDFALEFEVGERVSLVGYSLFRTQGGAYQYNELLSDEEILARLEPYGLRDEVVDAAGRIVAWAESHVAGCYQGPMGVDMFVYRRPEGYALCPMCEINFRYTMGLVAHEYLRRNPSHHGRRFSPFQEEAL